MSALPRTQDLFQRYVIHGAQEVMREISGPDEAFRSTRLKIYYDAYRLRLIEALATDYETLKAYLGDDQFDSVARAYIDAHPSVFRNVRWFGGRLAQFMREDQRYVDYPVLAELAEFEWTLALAFDAEDSPPLTFDSLARVALDQWPRIQFLAQPSLRTIELHWNVMAIWHAINDESTPPQPQASDRAVAVAIWRKEFAPYFRSLEADETTLWSCMRDGGTFSEACAALAGCVDADVAPQRAAAYLRRWVDDGWLKDFALSD